MEIVRHYDTLFQSAIYDELYDGSGFANWGYWDRGVETLAEANRRMVDKLLEPVTGGVSVLDVACGAGATTERIGRRFSRVTAANISHFQLSRTRDRAHGAPVVQMDAARLAFRDASFDVLVCVEAVFHFRSKVRFFFEAARVLKPGGWLTLSDFLVASPKDTFNADTVAAAGQADRFYPRENELNLAAYREVLAVAGFTEINFRSVYQQSWKRFCALIIDYCKRKAAADRKLAEAYETQIAKYRDMDAAICDYVLVSARMPA